MKRDQSKNLYERAARILPGGVNSPVRAFKAVGGSPLFIDRGYGCTLIDVDGNQYIDFVGSWGPLILGHAHPRILQVINEYSAKGTTYGAPTRIEIELCEKIREAFPSMEMMRLVNSGTEATMSALRAARGFTGKKNIIKFEGCYHGHHDSLLTSAGSGVATFDLPDSAGVPESFSRHTISVPYNDFTALERIPTNIIEDTAAVIIEPVAANMGLVPPREGFLESLREFTAAKNILLIFDEVITGFRLCFGGVQKLKKITPDMTCLGKIVGGGMPLAAYGGRAEIMQKIAPLGPVYQAGTLSGNPVAAAAGLAALDILQKEDPYNELENATTRFLQPLLDAISVRNLPVSLVRLGSMFTLFFTRTAPTNYAEVKTCNTALFARFFWSLIDRGIYTAPSQFESNFVGVAHRNPDLQYAATQFVDSLQQIFQQGEAVQ